MGGLVRRALLFRVYMRAPVFWKLPHTVGDSPVAHISWPQIPNGAMSPSYTSNAPQYNMGDY